MSTVSIAFRVNGIDHRLSIEPRRLLADVLRHDLGLTGTHVGCEQGVCGACTVLLDGELVRACLLFAVQADGCEVTTIEGLSTAGALHPIQQAFIEEFGFQCGFCTPGMILAAYRLLREVARPTPDEIRRGLSGHLCRCTGYADIVQSVQRASALVQAASEGAHRGR
ncbi:MAG: (2Fe-2S)-binding protein [Armatimonadota bacterium]|nr:(2Fe-2S)-binding protein [Armatimonadota bacterium]MDR7537573.1 (2Fe-2S)-binding protein [Armatimonadota bacterium]